MDSEAQGTTIFFLEFPVVGRGWAALNSIVNQVDGARVLNVSRSGSRGLLAFVSCSDEDKVADIMAQDPDVVWLPLKRGVEILRAAQALAQVEVNGDLLFFESKSPRDVLSIVDQALGLSERPDDVQVIDIRINQAGEPGACAVLNVAVGVSLEELRPAKTVVTTLVEEPHPEIRNFF